MPFDVEQVLAGLSLEQKASLTSGADWWFAKAPDGVTRVRFSDGPHGLRKRADDSEGAVLGWSVPATCFPPAVTLASAWDPELANRVGHALGVETAAEEVSVLLGPGVNIKRSPLCGRNFEYFSEDPHLAGRLGAAMVEGIQAEGVGASLKHYAANNQETDRMRVSAQVDERTLREIYLPAFEHVVTTAQPWTVMCSYNRINGTYAAEHHWLLTQVLRGEWGFEGLVVSDWGAVHDAVASVAAGLDLHMPPEGSRPDEEVAAAVREGRLDEAVLDASARRVLRLASRSLTGAGAAPDVAAHHALAREAAAAGAVLLKNDPVDARPVDARPLLPLAPDDLADLLVVGEFARTPRYQGAGSSQVNPTRVDVPLDALREATGVTIPFAAGFTLEGDPAQDATLLAEAIDAARSAGTVVAFLGLPAADESEGYDRPRLSLPANQVALLHALAQVNPRIVVVLANGSAVSAEWQQAAPAILETWLGGQAGGSATADLLLGHQAPEGRLAETIPLRLEDTPAYGNFPGELGTVRYGEGVLVGYRWYDTRGLDVAYPFGHGLTYTTFSYDDLTATTTGDGAQVTVQVTVRVTNTGPVAGAETVQVYVRDPHASVQRPTRELKAFQKVRLTPGASTELTFELTARDLSYWHPTLHRWIVEGGQFVIEIGASSRDIRHTTSIDVAGEPLVTPLTSMSTIEEWLAHPAGGPAFREALAAVGAVPPVDPTHQQVPLETAVAWEIVPLAYESLAGLVGQANAPTT